MNSILRIGCFLSILVISNSIPTAKYSNTTYEGPKYVPEWGEFEIQCHTTELKYAKWIRNGYKIELSPSQNVTESGKDGIKRTFTFHEKNATKDSAGEYVCHNQSESHHEIVIITGYVTNEPEPGKALVVDLWKSFELVCNVSAVPQEDSMTVEWYKEKDILILDEDHKYKTYNSNNTLLVLNATEEDCITYSCRFNSSENLTSHNFKVESRPLIHPKFPKSINKVEGESLTLNCVAFGVPTPNIVWLKDNNDVNTTGNSRISTTLVNQTLTLTINDLEEEDRADYNCTARNEHGIHSSVILVRVKDKLAALWPFLGIVAEVAVLCTIIFIYEKRRAKQEFEESDTDQSPDTKNVTENKDKDVRQRK